MRPARIGMREGQGEIDNMSTDQQIVLGLGVGQALWGSCSPSGREDGCGVKRGLGVAALKGRSGIGKAGLDEIDPGIGWVN